MIQELTRIGHSEDIEDAPEILVTDLTRLPEIDQSQDAHADNPATEA